MAVNWQRVLVSLCLSAALLLIVASIYFQVQSRDHFGRLNKKATSASLHSVVEISSTEENSAEMNPNQISIKNEIYSINVYGSESSASSSSTSNEVKNVEDQTSEYLYTEIFTEHSAYNDDYYTENFTENIVNIGKKLLSATEIDEKPLTILSNLAISNCTADIDKYNQKRVKLNETCLECICEATSECKPSLCSGNKPCGLFRISRFYWIDGGKPTVVDDNQNQITSNIKNTETNSETDDEGYRECANDCLCSIRAVIGYINKYSRDCNKDGIIDCRDHIALHLLGPAGCKRTELSPVFRSRMDNCLAKFE